MMTFRNTSLWCRRTLTLSGHTQAEAPTLPTPDHYPNLSPTPPLPFGLKSRDKAGQPGVGRVTEPFTAWNKVLQTSFCVLTP